ncbi:uncharacterized protein F5147DRAFT_784630 [Suillus discolor]|uniref:DUF6533 domain-containing protein n=1 Tax=Suillus discolor TaxID=1912936 RepID=A0A9P7EQP6_9AGAM|nr:uncharacterized protein F5147DRAFT_784630 [Suillus discolor]KAG2079948.1 hypothetical protein F5147DRAFT_784630 [Suillus discolor]
MDAVTTQSVTLDSLHARSLYILFRSITLSPSDVLLYLKFVAIVSFTILCWDHMITFVDEVDLIWCKHKGLAGYLFLLNRYITPLGFVVNIIDESVLTLPNWPTKRFVASDLKMTGIKLLLSCRNFVRYQGAMVILGVSIAELIMLMRVHALYRECRLVIAAIGLLLLVQVAFEAYLMALGKRPSSLAFFGGPSLAIGGPLLWPLMDPPPAPFGLSSLASFMDLSSLALW